MRCFWILALLVATTGFMAGCNNSDSSSTPSDEGVETQDTTDQESDNEATDDQASTTSPAAIVTAFLEAARMGNDEQVALLFTPTARKELARAGLNVAPPASDTVRFEVVETRMANNKKVAHVASRWIEQPTPSSEPQVTEMAWALRLTEEEGWRIGGMAMVPFEGEGPLLLNYEKPAEVVQQYEMLRKEIARREAEAEQKTLLR